VKNKNGGNMDIGFIGIGQMGRHMANHIWEAGFTPHIYDVNKEAAAPLLHKGCKWCDSPAEIARQCRIVITSLPTPKDVEQVVYGEKGLMKGWKPGDIYVDMSTNSPSVIKHIAEDAAKMGVSVLDAPVSGGTRGAEAGTLSIMVGGDMAALEKVKPILLAMGPKIFPVGPVGCGNTAKLVNNLISLASNSISAEGFAIGAKAGINPGVLLDIIRVSTGNNWSAQQYPNTTFKGNFEPGFKISLAFKDINLALDLAKETGVPVPVGEAVRQDLQNAMNAGLQDKGVDAVILSRENAAGVKVRLP
jgi:3-hydroxyisobutyrate dehydrogenase-like beta-hydroxyacid dehydrogenase